MRPTTSSIAMASSAAFVCALGLIGVFSHSGAGPLPAAGTLKGEFQSTYEDSFKDANPLREVAVGAFASLRYGLLSEASPGAIVGEDGWLFTAEEMDIQANFNANIHLSVKRIMQANVVLAARGVQLIVVVTPDKAEIYQDKLGLDRPAAVVQRRETFINGLDDFGIDRFDAAGALQNARAGGEVFMRDDTHWSPLGAKAVADAIGSRFHGADISRVEVKTTQLGKAAFDGDLLSFIPTGPFRDIIGPERRLIERFETSTAASGGLFGETVVDVALIGTSFSAKPDWHFEGFLKRALSADVLNLSLEGQGPFKPMDAFLASDILKTTPPKIVIWEIPVRYISKDLN